jgi:tetratricopeptide (TPR) repeat protein
MMPAARSYLRALLSVAALATVTFASAVDAQQQGGRETRRAVVMSEAVYKQLQAAQQAMEKQDHAGALKLLGDAGAAKKLSPYESAQIWNLAGYVHYLTEDYTQAIKAYENVLKQGDLPAALVQSTLKTLSQLYFIVEDYPRALINVQRLIGGVEKPDPELHLLLGQIYFQMGRYRDALEPVKTAVAGYRAQGQAPKENWLLLLRVIYHELQDYRAMVTVLKELLELYPKDQYLLTLAGVYSELGDTKKQLTYTEALYERGLLDTPGHLANLANLYLLHELPYRAAVLLEKEIAARKVEESVKNLRLLSQAWYQAREDERAIPPLARAAKLSEEGELEVRLAQSHINLEQWDEAAAAIRRGLKKGGVKRPDTANMLLGIALFNLQQLQQARDAFTEARDDRRSAKSAAQWITYIDSERARLEALADYGLSDG